MRRGTSKISRRMFSEEAWPKAKRVVQSQSHRAIPTLLKAQGVAVQIARARPNRLVSIDDVQRHLIECGFRPLGACAGSVFTPRKRWTLAGWHPSTRLSNRHRAQRIWRLVER